MSSYVTSSTSPQVKLGYSTKPNAQPEPFEGLIKRRAKPERQHFPFLAVKVDFLGLELTVNDDGGILVLVNNNGNGVAFTPVIEIIESPYNSLSAPNADPTLYQRCGYQVLPSLYPNQSYVTAVNCSPNKQSSLLIVICYDPILDPRPQLSPDSMSQPEFRRKIGTGWW